MRYAKDETILVSEYPKSGGSWLSEMLADASGLPFPRNRFPTSRSIIFHGHYLSRGRVGKPVVLWRDPRDVMISWYHHCIIGNTNVQPDFIRRCRRDAGIDDPQDVLSNLERFVAWTFDRPVSPRFSWSDFFDAWREEPDVWHVRYEDLRAAPVETFGALVRELRLSVSEETIVQVVDRHSFERRSGRKAGDEDKASFMRKGLVGDWRNYFGESALEALMRRAGTRMATLGYGADGADVWKGGPVARRLG